MHRGQGGTKNTTKIPWYRQGIGLLVDTGRGGSGREGKIIRQREGGTLDK